MTLSPTSSHGGTTLGNVTTVTGTPAAGQELIATSATAAGWATSPGTELDYAQITASVSITATSEATATTIVTGGAVTYDGSTVILLQFYTPTLTVPASAECIVVLYQDGATLGFMHDQPASAGGAVTNAVNVFRRITPTAGAHTYSIRAYRVTSNCTVQGGAGNGAATYMPAFLRTIKAA